MADGERVKFGPYEADLKTGELFRRGIKVPIQQKPFQLLALLLQRPGELVTREELQELLWPDTFVQKDLSLNTAVRKLRLALGEKGHGGRFIETVGSRGYRFSQHIVVSGSVGQLQPAPSPRRIRLAVMPLENLSGPEHELFSDGLSEQLIARLGRMTEQVSVIAPVSSMQYKRTAKDAAQICQELRCDYVLSGSVLSSGGRVRVTAKLIRGSDQSCVWTESFASDHAEILAIQDEIAIQIAHAMRTMLPRTKGTSGLTPSTSPEVLARYLKATTFANQAFDSGFENAARLLREALEIEPNFALAHADLARLYANAAMFGIMPAEMLFREVRAHANAALAISSQIESAHIALGYLHFYFEAGWDEAAHCFRRAAAINPSCVWAYIGLSQLMTATGALQKGIEYMRQAHELDPVSPIVVTMLGCAYYFAADYDNAERILNEGLALFPGFPIALASLSWVDIARGRGKEAVAYTREACEHSHDSPLMVAQHCYALATAGETRKARTLLAELHGSTRLVPSYWLALCELALHDADAAVNLLERCHTNRCAWRVLMSVDPKLQPLSAHPRFRALLHEMRFPEAAAGGR
jgi:TolB-like protein/tetratricopeptide (TPR) repeat protein